MLINVTEECIKRGFRVDCGRCPVAVALRECFGDAVSVGYDLIRINDKSLVTPKVVRKFIDTFDKGDPVKPFTFILDLEKLQ
jgi:hypothetical protein